MSERKEMSTWWGDEPMMWATRDEEELVGSSDGGHLLVPQFFPANFISEPNQPVLFLNSSTNRALIEAPFGTQRHFYRNADFDDLHFQLTGQTFYETELGTFTALPGELILVPAGVSYRSTGRPGSLRLTLQVNEPVEVRIGEDQMQGHTEFDAVWNGAPDWGSLDETALCPKGEVFESVRTWDDKSGELTLVRRRYETLVGSASGGRPVTKLRLFDIFTEMTGVRGPGPIPLANADFFIECYNTIGEQWAFHRGNRNDEAQFQYAGSADGLSEFGTGTMFPGDIYIQKRGISHRVKGGREYRRMVFYSKQAWTLCVDPEQPVRQTSLEVKERVVERAPWRDEWDRMAAELGHQNSG